MANEEHLKILLQGVEVWNQWRQENPKIKPDLVEAKLRGAKLRGANLSGAYLGGVNLSRADLSIANFSYTDLREGYLSYANISGAKLEGADLRGADLSVAQLGKTNINGADLSYANISGANLIGTYLRGANLIGAKLEGVQLGKADLSYADLSETNLSYADLSETNLSEAILSGTNLSEAILSGANLNEAVLRGASLSGINISGKDFTGKDLSGAELQNTNLQRACFIDANLDGANLTNARLWETQRAGWSIKGVICEYVYWDKDAKEKTEYAPGEFERLFAEQTKIRLSYKGGISPLEIATLPALIQHLEDMQGCALRFVSIQEASGGAIVELAIEDTEEKSSQEIAVIKRAIEENANRDIEILRQRLIGKEDEIKLLTGKVEGLKESITTILKESRGDTYNIHGQAGAVGPHSRAEHNALTSTSAKKTEDE